MPLPGAQSSKNIQMGKILERESMHIVLIRPDLPKEAPIGRLFPQLPMGLAFIAAILEQHGFKITIIDDYLERKGAKQLAGQVSNLKVDLIGITCNLATVITTAEIVKELLPFHIPIVLGGPEVTVNPERTLTRTNAPIGICGEGEHTMLELCHLLANNALTNDSLKDILGIIYRLPGGEVKLNPSRPLINDLDELPFLPLHLFPMDKYERTMAELSVSPVDVLSTSRGCPFNCSFCNNKYVWGRSYRTMSGNRIANELEFLIKDYGTKGVFFREDHFTLNKRRVYEFCAEIERRKINMQWGCESRADALDEDMIGTMKKAGCESIWFGVESGSLRVLKMLNKKIDLEQVEYVFKLCKKHKIQVGASVMIGIPGQTLEENYETLKFVKKLDPDYAYFNTFVGYPKTDMYDVIVEKKLIYQKWEDLILPNSEVLTWQEKVRFKEKAELRYNTRPKVLLRHLKRMGIKRFLKKTLNTLYRFYKVRSFNKKDTSQVLREVEIAN